MTLATPPFTCFGSGLDISMERKFDHEQRLTFFGSSRFFLIAQVSLDPDERDAAKRYRFLNSVVYAGIDLAQRKKESLHGWLFRLLTASTTGQIIRLSHLVDGVSLSAPTITEITRIEAQINDRLEAINTQLIAASNHWGTTIATIGDDDEKI